MHACMQKMVLIAKVVSTRLLNFVKSKVVIFQSDKVICKRVLVHKPFLNLIIILCGENYFYQSKTLCFSPNEFLLQNLVFWVSRFGLNHFPKAFFSSKSF